jgi:hypothetical protein
MMMMTMVMTVIWQGLDLDLDGERPGTATAAVWFVDGGRMSVCRSKDPDTALPPHITSQKKAQLNPASRTKKHKT